MTPPKSCAGPEIRAAPVRFVGRQAFTVSVNAFRDGPFADLLMAAAKYTVHLAERHHFLAAPDLVQFVSPCSATSEGMIQELAGVKQHCVDRALYNRSSPRGCDVLLWCSEADDRELQLTLAALLRDLGVLVA